MGLVIVLFAALFTISHSNSSFVHPSGIALIAGFEPEELDCQPSESSNLSLESGRPTRTVNFRLLGKFDCHRPVFAAGERDPFIDRLLRVQGPRAKRVASEVGARLRNEGRLLYLDIDGLKDEKLIQAVSVLYRAELFQALGKGRVARLSMESTEAVKAGHVLLRLEVRRVDDADIMVQARLALGKENKRGEPQWLEL